MNFTFNCNGRLLVLEQPVVMGILNATPDSFYTGSGHYSPGLLLEQAGQMLEEGATILDIGGMSTRPGAGELSLAEEADRVLPFIAAIRKHYPECYISIDTYRAMIAKEAVQAGADIVNDISAGNLDTDMLQTVGSLGVPYIAMHMQGRPATMQHDPVYDDVVEEVLKFFIEKSAACGAAGIKDLILDPGFGFGKTVAHNYQLLKGLPALAIPGHCLLAGVSRKSMICKILKVQPAEALNGTTALHMLCLQQGAHILRAHDVREAAECIQLYQYYQTI